jgi:hypothetical protein
MCFFHKVDTFFFQDGNLIVRINTTSAEPPTNRVGDGPPEGLYTGSWTNWTLNLPHQYFHCPDRFQTIVGSGEGQFHDQGDNVKN